MKYEAVLYDLDGTLIDSVPFIVKCFKIAYENVFGSCERQEEELKTFIGKPLEDAFMMHDPETAATLKKAYLEVNERLLREDAVDLFPNVYEDLYKLKALGVKQGIVTSKRELAAMITVNLKNIADAFDVFVFLEDSTKHKPDGEPLEVAAQKLGITDMKKILYVGDALPDALCSANAGTDFALVNWSVMPREEILSVRNTHILSSIGDVSCILGDSEL